MIEKTLVLIKPDGVRRKLIGKIINFYEEKNLTISSLKMLRANRNTAEQHYIEHKNKNFYGDLVDYITESNIIAMIIEGDNAIKIVRKINGATDPLESDMGSIRGKFANQKQENLVHASDNNDNAEREITLWFPELKIFNN
jgi:nucleoside-diphosphate kinase